ncbi:tetratricopeptide repeat protein [bacterium]|nr:tetratricopeptide repeat protein [bacterium]
MNYNLLCALGLLLLGCSRTSPPPPATSASPAQYAHEAEHGTKIDDQIQEMESRIQSNPADWVSMALLSKLYLEKGEESPADYLKAEKLALLSLSIRPVRNSEALLALAGVRYQQGEYPAVLKICQQMPGSPDAPRLAVRALLAQGKIREAASWTEQALKRQNDAYSLTLAAQVSVQGGRDDIAQQLLNAARQVEQPKQRDVSAELRSLWGDLLRRHGKFKEAREMLESSLTIQRRNVPALRALARLELDQGNTEAALESYRQAEALTHGPRLLLEVAALDPAQAPELLKKADPLLLGAQRAPLLLLQKKPEQALKLLKQQEKTGANWENFQLQAEAYQQLKQPGKALEAYDRALAQGYLDPLLIRPALELAKAQKDQKRAAAFELKLNSLKAN